MAAMKSEMEDVKTKTSAEHLSKEIQRIVGSAAVRGSSAPPRTSTQIGQENLFCGPRKDLPSYDQRKTDIIYASDKLNMTFNGKIESGDALDLAKKTIENQGPLDAPIEIAEVNHAGDSTRIVIKLGKTATKKASQNRTAARNKWSPLDPATGRPTMSLSDDDLNEVKVKMYSPIWMKYYFDPLYEVKTLYVNQQQVNADEVRVDTKRQMLFHGDDALAVLRFDGSVMLTSFLMNKNVSA